MREFLEADVLDAVDGRVKFHTRVAVNVLGMVERQLVEDPDAEENHRRTLVALLGSDGDLGELEAELAAAIRNGSLDARADVYDLVLAEVRRKLAVANPGYASPV